MGPDQVLSPPRDVPRSEGFSTDERAQQLALDFRDASSSRYTCELAMELFDSHYKGVVAAGLDAEKRPSEVGVREWNARAAKTIERFSSRTRNEYPGTTGRLVERK